MAKRAEPPQVLRHVYQRQTPRYTPRRPERTLLYRVVAENLETFLEAVRERNVSGLGLPRYVEREFREYLRCGVLCHGFTKLASCLRGSLGIDKVVQVTVEGDLRATEEDLNAQRFALLL